MRRTPELLPVIIIESLSKSGISIEIVLLPYFEPFFILYIGLYLVLAARIE
jgi:hypothetical protein